MIDNKMQISKKTKAVIISLIIVIFISCFVPLYQVCIYQQRQYQLRANVRHVEELEEDIRVLNAKISYSKTPEALINQVIEQQLDYKNIDYNSSFRIARNY
jgi:type II secretory pathway component PulM